MLYLEPFKSKYLLDPNSILNDFLAVATFFEKTFLYVFFDNNDFFL